MNLLLALLLAAQLTQPVPIGDALVLESNSPGLNPYMKSNYINEYAPDLTYVRTAAFFPLVQSPRAMTFSPSGDIFVGEYCEPSPCVQIMRYAQSGAASLFGAPIRDSVMAMQFIASGDLIVLLSGMLGRIDASGRMVESTPLPVETLFDGFDVDADQCTVLFAGLDKLGLTNMCADVRPAFLAVPGNFFDARFLPNGNILAASRGVVLEVDRRGAAVRSFITSQSDYGLLAIDPDGTSFRTTANNRQFRFDLNTGNPLAPPAWLRNAVYGTRSMAIRGEWRAALHTTIGRRSMRR